MQKFDFYEVKPCGLSVNKEIPTEKIYIYNDKKVASKLVKSRTLKVLKRSVLFEKCFVSLCFQRSTHANVHGVNLITVRFLWNSFTA